MKTNYRCMREGEAVTEAAAAATPLDDSSSSTGPLTPVLQYVAACRQSEAQPDRQTEGDTVSSLKPKMRYK